MTFVAIVWLLYAFLQCEPTSGAAGFFKGKVLVAGATGRVGSLVVNELLTWPNTTLSVVAAVRDSGKARNLFENSIKYGSERLEIIQCDLSDPNQLKKACDGVDAAIWCASGFSDRSSLLNRVLGLFRIIVTPKESMDIASVRALGEAFAGRPNNLCNDGPQVVLCSSAGVTRPIWSAEKKQKFVGAADIPIVRLNPFGILDVKRAGEQALRESGAKYCIVRPCGLNDKWPNGRQILSQGDIAVGRINRGDVAKLLTAMLFEVGATQKTFESIALADYPKSSGFGLQLSRLLPDDQDISDSALEATYNILQQLVPGETLQPNQLAMGQTYEQLDKGQEGRLGQRGTERPPIVQEN